MKQKIKLSWATPLWLLLAVVLTVNALLGVWVYPEFINETVLDNPYVSGLSYIFAFLFLSGMYLVGVCIFFGWTYIAACKAFGLKPRLISDKIRIKLSWATPLLLLLSAVLVVAGLYGLWSYPGFIERVASMWQWGKEPILGISFIGWLWCHCMYIAIVIAFFANACKAARKALGLKSKPSDEDTSWPVEENTS